MMMEPRLNLLPEDEEFVERVARFFEADAAPRTSGRMMGLLLLAPRELSMDEIAERLRTSRASVSTNARQLEQWGVVERVSHLGDRRDFYRLAPDLERTLLRHRSERLARVGDLLAGGAETPLGQEAQVGERLRRMAALHRCAAEAVERCRAEAAE